MAEDLLIIQEYKKYGSHWAEIGKRLHWRSDNAIKNRRNCSIARRIHVDSLGKESLIPESFHRGKGRNAGRERDLIGQVPFSLPGVRPVPVWELARIDPAPPNQDGQAQGGIGLHGAAAMPNQRR
jgi:hypothetical protein